MDSPPRTRKEPSIDVSIPAKAIAKGNNRREIFVDTEASSAVSPRAKATRDIGAIIEPA